VKKATVMSLWHNAEVIAASLDFRLWGNSGPGAESAAGPTLTRLYGPAVRCKRFRQLWLMRSCINVSGF